MYLTSCGFSRVALLFLFVVLDVNPNGRAESWPTYGHDAQHTGRSFAAFDPRQLTLSWESPILDGGYQQPIIVGDRVYALDFRQSGPAGSIASFRLSDGAVNWSVPYVGGSSISSLAYADGLLAYTADTDHLVVIDALTGGTRYSIPNVPGTFRSNGPSPSLVFDVQGNLIAYTVGPGSAAATQLGANSGTRLWIQPGSLGGATAPTLMGQSLLGAGPGQYYAYDQATGQVNHFVASALSGGGGAVIASDLARKQFYVPDGGWLTAYSYVDNDHITQLWSVAMSSLANAISLGKNGDIYTATSSRLIELDPATGQELRSVSGTFAPYAPPVVQGDYVWVGGSRLYAYDMATLTPIVSMPAASPDYYSYLPAAADDSHLIVNYVNGVGSNRGFLVYAVPEPSAGICTLGIGLILLTWRPRLRSILYHQTTGSSH